MGFFASVETDIGDHLRVLRPDGSTGGKAMLAFLVPLSLHCSGKRFDPDMLQWLSQLEARANEPVCQLSLLLDHAYYVGEWLSTDDVYEWLLHGLREGTLNADKLENNYRQIIQKWVELGSLSASVNELVKLLSEANLEAAYWYEPGETEADFNALARTLALAAERRARSVRIKFT